MNSEQLRKHLLEKIEKLSKKHKELNQLKEMEIQEELKDRFFELLLKIRYAKAKIRNRETRIREQRDELIKKAELIADKIPEFRGWPHGSKFWDIESFGWLGNIPQKVRESVSYELSKRIAKGRTLSLGSGNYPYIDDSVMLDYSEEMLNSADKSNKKILYDLNNQQLPFKDISFDSATLVFVLNYLEAPKQLFMEIRRILRKNGKLIIIQPAKPISYFYKKKEKKQWSSSEIINLLSGFKASITNKTEYGLGLSYIEAVKQ